MIALLCSVPREANLLLAAITAVEAVPIGSRTLFRGSVSNKEIALCIGGLGKANAAHAATLMLTHFKPGALVIFGLGGAYPSSRAAVCDLAVATEEIAGDEGVVTNEGFKDTELIGIPLIKTDTITVYNRLPAPDKLSSAALKTLSRTRRTRRVHSGRFVTLSTCTGTSGRARELEALYGGLCENMEGAAAAQVVVLHNVPWLEVRAISNIVEDRDLRKWDVPGAAKTVQDAVREILEGWGD